MFRARYNGGKTNGGPKMTSWFNRGALPNFAEHATKRPVRRYLEIGTWEGDSLFWVFRNVKPAFAIAVDPYPADRKRTAAENRQRGYGVQRRWSEHFRHIDGNIYFEPSSKILPELLAANIGSFDFIYVDGSHRGGDVMFDASLCWRMLAPGGLMIFDDWEARAMSNVRGLRLAVDTFVRLHRDELSVEFVNRQFGIRRYDDPAADGTTLMPGATHLETGENERCSRATDSS